MTREIKNKIELILVALMFVLIIGIVSADVCCEKTANKEDGTGGAWCQNALQEECDLNYQSSPNLCEDTTYCETGCCFDPVEGLCTTAPQQKCTDDEGEWDEDETCSSSSECTEGCCEWERNTQFITEIRCEYISSSEGYINWDKSKVDCRFFSEAEGACVLDVGVCTHAIEEDCIINLEGTFYDGYCSGVPDATCTAEYSTGCAVEENLYDVYNFDSCGNREDAVTPLCDYPSEKCVGGICENLGCIDKEGNARDNTESWCVYDAYVGDSRDAAGSTHWLRWCDDGVIKSQACNEPSSNNYRKSICAEEVIGDFSIAQCRINLGFMCYGIDNKEECEDIPDCRIHNVDVDEYFKFDACIPKYPLGFDINSESDEENGKDMCALGTQTCTMGYSKCVWESKYKCRSNCECRKYVFAKQMNDFCISLGDCGGYVNIEGEYTQGFEIKGKKSEYKGKDLKTTDINTYESDLTEENEEENTPQHIFGLDEDNVYLNVLSLFNNDIKYEMEWREFNVFETGFWLSHISFVSAEGATNLFVTMLLGEEALEKLGVCKVRKKEVKFNCLPWKPPVGGDDCSKCNEDPLKKCNEYRCSSLGTACGLINTGYEYPICIDKYPDDSAPPVISLGEVFTEGYKFMPETSTGVRIRTETTKECIQEFTLINFSLNTNEYAWCKFNYETTNWNDYETTGEYSKELNELTKNHTFEIRLPYLDSLNMYIRCQDPAGNLNIDEYVVNFCIIEGLDFKPPTIIRAEPESGSFLGYGVTENVLEIYLEEPAECKYDVVENTAYDYMSNDFFCEDADEIKIEYSCSTTLTGLTERENKIYIRCNDTFGNINPNDYDYILYATENKLQIDLISPENGSVIEKSTSDREIELEVTTSGGMNNDGVSECEYKFVEQGWSDWFTENAAYHEYIFTSLPEGYYKINVTCKDAAENLATNITEFTLNIDDDGPVITNQTPDGDNLILTTDEDAECYYNLTNCNFALDGEDATSISTMLDTTHTISNFNPKIDYHVKCADVWGNTNCTTIEATNIDDETAPIVVRAFKNYGDLKLITNEDAKCYYGLYNCTFVLDSGTLMTTAFSTEHTANWVIGQIYYIKCEDDFGNPKGVSNDCTIIVEASSLY